MYDDLAKYADRVVKCLKNNGIDNFIRFSIRRSQIHFIFDINGKEKTYCIDGDLYMNYLHAMPYEVANYLTYYIKSNIEVKWCMRKSK